MKTKSRFNKKRILLAMVAAGCALLAWFLLNSGRPNRLAIYSKVLGEKRHILIHLPEGYGRDKAPCPLIILLDGGDRKQFSADRPLYSRSVAILSVLEKEGLPPMILVGIDNRNRVRDMTPIERPDIYIGGGGAEAFMRFIENEVLPYVASRWRVSSIRILYGESYGGLFVLDALARGPQSFSDYIAVSPTVGVWPKELAALFRRRCALPSAVRSLFIVYGDRDAPLVIEYTAPFVREIERLLPAGFRLRQEILPGEGHAPASSLARGLRFIFGDKR